MQNEYTIVSLRKRMRVCYFDKMINKDNTNLL